MEDIVNTNQRPKMDDYGDHIYIVIKMITFNDHSENNLQVEQVSLILGSNYVISIQEQVGDVFDIIRDRLRNAKGRIRTMDADYLAYSLIDATVDSYFPRP